VRCVDLTTLAVREYGLLVRVGAEEILPMEMIEQLVG
jgi:hypothetical protein